MVCGRPFVSQDNARLVVGGRPLGFSTAHFSLLNLAIGGPSTFLGKPDPNAPFPPQDMLVDYVRVYQLIRCSVGHARDYAGRVVNSASYLGTLAPGSLAALYGVNLTDAEHVVTGVASFPVSVAGVSVSINGVDAPLLYLSPTQINFQIPWETVPGPNVQVKVAKWVR